MAAAGKRIEKLMMNPDHEITIADAEEIHLITCEPIE
jgi:hypothetical protein